MALSDDDVREILRLIDESQLDELRIETPDLKLHVLRGARATAAPEAQPAAERAPRAAEPAQSGQRAASPDATPEPAASPATASPDAAAAATAAGDGALTIEAPMLGTFYRAPEPGAEPFVDVGTRVEPGTVVCLIEVMKMMNSVQAGVAGTIVEVCADNAEVVEHGDPLFRLEPA
jgi:acetyl-CoA carboxylase biotin carboxyl carrier protein